MSENRVQTKSWEEAVPHEGHPEGVFSRGCLRCQDDARLEWMRELAELRSLYDSVCRERDAARAELERRTPHFVTREERLEAGVVDPMALGETSEEERQELHRFFADRRAESAEADLTAVRERIREAVEWIEERALSDLVGRPYRRECADYLISHLLDNPDGERCPTEEETLDA